MYRNHWRLAHCICCRSGQQEYGVNYWETYSPVVNALTAKLLFVVAKLHDWGSKSIDFVFLAFPQTEVMQRYGFTHRI